MLGFILSKMNLLILVTAIFAIVAFFTVGLIEITKVTQASDLVTRVTEKSFSMASSPSYCLKDRYVLDEDIRVSGAPFYYVLKISQEKVETKRGDTVNVVIYSIYPRTEITKFYENSNYDPKAIAANSFRTKAEVFFYSQDYRGSFYDGDVTEQEEIFLDPQAVVPANAIEFVKEIELGKPKLYIIGCNDALCSANKTTIGDKIRPPQGREEGGFFC